MHTAEPAVTEAGLLLSLAAQLPDPHSPLCRRAARLAGKLSDGASSRAVHREAADLLAVLLEAADADLSLEGDNLLCSEWDE